VAVCSIIKELAWRLRGFIGLTIAIGFPRPLGFSAGLLLVLLAHFGLDFPEGGGKSGKAFQVAESLHRKTDANVTANDCGAPSSKSSKSSSSIGYSSEWNGNHGAQTMDQA